MCKLHCSAVQCTGADGWVTDCEAGVNSTEACNELQLHRLDGHLPLPFCHPSSTQFILHFCHNFKPSPLLASCKQLGLLKATLPSRKNAPYALSQKWRFSTDKEHGLYKWYEALSTIFLPALIRSDQYFILVYHMCYAALNRCDQIWLEMTF